MKSGLLSITFRKLDPDAVIELARAAGLESIEWGGDIHVPPGKPEEAAAIGRRTREAGLSISAYGSYYRLGHPDTGPIEAVLETARALETGVVRVWAGRKGSDEADPAERVAVEEDARNACRLAADAGLKIACEWHANTLTDTAASATSLFAAVDEPNFVTLWQPRNYQNTEFNLVDMEAALPRLVGLHVFHWDLKTRARLPLVEGTTPWKAYLAKASTAEPLSASLEFVADDSPERMLEDVVTLKRWLSEI